MRFGTAGTLRRTGVLREQCSLVELREFSPTRSHKTIKGHRMMAPFCFGGDEEDRTPDLRIANATLSQLSYVPFIIRPAPEAPKSPRYYTGIKFRQNESPPYEDRAAAGLRADHAAAKEPQGRPAAHGRRDTRGLSPAARDATQSGRIRAGQPRLPDRLRQCR